MQAIKRQASKGERVLYYDDTSIFLEWYIIPDAPNTPYIEEEEECVLYIQRVYVDETQNPPNLGIGMYLFSSNTGYNRKH
jgi:hypothetical protein